MPPPVDPAADFRRTRARSLRDIGYRAYDPAADDGAADPHADAESCVGVRGPVTVAWDGGRSVPACDWTVTGVAGTPVTRSLVVDGADVWVVTSVEPDPAAGTVHRLRCVKG